MYASTTRLPILTSIALIAGFAAPAMGDCTVGPPLLYSAGERPEALALGDLDGDSFIDVAAVDSGIGSNKVRILLNDGSGAFSPSATYGTGERPRAIAIDDLDGDSDRDLAIANWGSGDVSILLNNGDGTFAPDQVFPAGGQWPGSISLGDYDGDGDVDVAVTNWGSNGTGVLLNNGDGTFGLPTMYYGAGAPSSVASGDLDGDLDLDLAVTSYATDQLLIWLNQGNGVFFGGFPYSVGDSPMSIALGDLDGDLDLDFTVANYGGASVSVLLNSGNGTPVSSTTHAAGTAPRGISLGDLDNDLDLDMVIVDQIGDTVAIHRNSGSGTFDGIETYSAGDGPYSVSVADLDGDLTEDLAIAVVGSPDLGGSGVAMVTLECEGGCCIDGDTCLDLDPSACSAAMGTYLGSASSCSTTFCPPPASCPADLNISGSVDASDIAYLISVWGPCPGCPQDISGDGQVDEVDLAFLTENWGPCPNTLPGTTELFNDVVVVDVTNCDAAALGLIVTHVYATGSAVGAGDALLLVDDVDIDATGSTTFFQPGMFGSPTVPPTSDGLLSEPLLAYDTFVTMGALIDAEYLSPSFLSMDDTMINGAWISSGGTERQAMDISDLTGQPDQHGVLIAQITLDAGSAMPMGYSGTLRLFTSTFDGGALVGTDVTLSYTADQGCRQDLSANGAVDFADLLAVIAAYGPCSTECPEDLDCTGDVGYADVLQVISNWGACP